MKIRKLAWLLLLIFTLAGCGGGGTTLPSTPTGLTATSGNSEVTLSWNSVSGAISYNLYMASASGITKSNYSSLANGMNHTGVTSPFTHTGLTNGTTYYFVVTAVNAEGESTESSEVSAAPVPAVTIPGAPSDLQTTAVASTQIDITWTDNSANEDGFKIERKTGAGGTYSQIATVGTNVTNYSDTAALVANTVYCYQVQAFNTVGNSGYSNESCTTTPTSGTVASAPTGVAATPGDGQVTISWNAVSGATSYNLYMASVSGVTKSNYSTLADGMKHANAMSPYTHTGLTNGTTYYYVVTAQNDSGESNESIEVSVTLSNLITVNIVAPSKGSLVGNTLQISVTSSSTYQIQGITASVEDLQTILVFSNTAVCNEFGCGPGWTGTISLNGLVRGEKKLTVTATDFFGNSVTASTSFVYDQKPNLIITEPMNDTVAQSQLHIAVSCTDDDPAGCKSLSVAIGIGSGTVIASGQTSIDQTVSLTTYDGTSVVLSFTATDSAGQVSTESRIVFIESSAKLVEVASVTGGIWDVQPDRILFLDISGGGNILKIRDRSSGVDTVVMDETGEIPQYGFLTTKGAIFVEQSGSVSTSRLYDWRDGVLVDLGYPNSSSSLKVKGDYAIWNEQPLLILRDLVSGSNTTIATDTGNWMNDVASNGDIVYWHGSSYQIYRYRGGVTLQLTNDSTLWNTYPLTDGVNAIYRKHSPCCSNQTYEIAMYTASGEQILTPAMSQKPRPDADYQVNNGWTAFTSPGTDGVFQIWLRSPASDLTQLSFFGTSSSIDALGSNGDITWIFGSRRYLSTSGALTVDIGSSLGKSIYQGGQWYVIIGRSLFSIAP